MKQQHKEYNKLNKDKINNHMKDKYKNDGEYRKQINEMQREYYQNKKELNNSTN